MIFIRAAGEHSAGRATNGADGIYLTEGNRYPGRSKRAGNAVQKPRKQKSGRYCASRSCHSMSFSISLASRVCTSNFRQSAAVGICVFRMGLYFRMCSPSFCPISSWIAYFTLTDWLFHSGGLPVRFNGLKFIPFNISAGTAVPTAASLL